MAKGRHSPQIKFQVVLETLTGEKTPKQIAKQYWIKLRAAAEEDLPRVWALP